jgi:ribosomal protein S18 acetylase RimI-like enzyme
VSVEIRPYQPDDLGELKRITVESFEGLALDQRIEEQIGVVHKKDWRWRKARDVEEDVGANPTGVFVALQGNRILGYISTRIDREAGKGRIPNLAVVADARGSGLGRQLIEHALKYFRQEGMAFAVIETMAYNEVGNHLYPSCGFVEVGRQVHFARKL